MNWKRALSNVLIVSVGGGAAIASQLPPDIPVTFGTVGVPTLALLMANLLGLFQPDARPKGGFVNAMKRKLGE